jgi:large subunit ribosomal protein L32
MAIPKRKTSKGRKNRRRAHDGLKKPSVVKCPQCNQPKPPHRACPGCGFYKGRHVMSIKEA